MANSDSKVLRYLVTVLGLAGVVAGLGIVKGKQIGQLIAFGKRAEASGPPPEAVGVAQADARAWEGAFSAVGTVAPAKGVRVSNEAPGTVARIFFESGAIVMEGQVLVELDASVERSQLASAMSRRELAVTTAKRSRSLLEKGAISPSQVDNDESVLKTATTDVETIQAQIARKTVRAPFAGKLGIRQVNVGQYLNPGTPLTVLESLDKLYVDFTLPQQRLSEVKLGLPVRVMIDGVQGDAITGAIAAIDPTLDGATRAIKLRASLTDNDARLRSGMFVNVSIVRPETQNVVVVPATAIVHASYGDSVFVVEERKPDAPGASMTPDGKPVKNARQQFVKVGETRGDFVAILDGVKAGQQVVSVGAFKLRNNAPIFPGEVSQLRPEVDPKPKDR